MLMKEEAMLLHRLLAVGAAVLCFAGPAAAGDCPGNPKALGVSRTVEIDTKGGPGFGMEHYRAYDFLQDKEVLLTFDDGPQVRTTHAILKALAHHCTKATFFSIGKMAVGLPEILRDVAKGGHTVGTHTWSHKDLSKLKPEQAKEEIEKGASGVARAAGVPVSTFFRYPFLRDSKDTLAHLGGRNIGIFSTDIDSFDFKMQSPDRLVKSVMSKLAKHGKGILLMHDIQPTTAKALPKLLDELAAAGYKVVHMRSKDTLKTLAQYDAEIEKSVKGLPAAGAERPLASVVKTIDK
jgi:peptidoglycan/xylan/chitin deacetylase (PgdA/CDA1 family)